MESQGHGVEVTIDELPVAQGGGFKVTITVTQELFETETGEPRGEAHVVLSGRMASGSTDVEFGEPEYDLPPGCKDEEESIAQVAQDFLEVLVRAELN